MPLRCRCDTLTSKGLVAAFGGVSDDGCTYQTLAAARAMPLSGLTSSAARAGTTTTTPLLEPPAAGAPQYDDNLRVDENGEGKERRGEKER